MATLSLTDISGSTPVRGFDEIYNANNTLIENKISDIEYSISETNDSITSMESDHSTRLNQLSQKINTLTEDLSDKINKKYDVKYENLLRELEESNDVIKVLGTTLITLLTLLKGDQKSLTDRKLNILTQNVTNALNTLNIEITDEEDSESESD